MQLIATDWWCGFFLFPPFGQNITLNYTIRSYYLHFFHILLIQRIFIFMFIILCDIISYSIWFSLLNHLNSSGNGHGQLFLSFFYFSSFFVDIFSISPTVSCLMHIHTSYWAITRMASLATISSPLLCPPACHSYTIQENKLIYWIVGSD